MKKVKSGLWCKMFHRRIRSFYMCRTLIHARLSTDVKRPQKSPVISPWSGSSGNYDHIFPSSKKCYCFLCIFLLFFLFLIFSPFFVSLQFPLFSLFSLLCQFILISIFISLSCFLSIAHRKPAVSTPSYSGGTRFKYRP